MILACNAKHPVKVWFIIQLKEPRKDMFSISFRFFQKLPKNMSRSFGFYSATETGCGSLKKNSEIQWGNKNEGNSKTRAVTVRYLKSRWHIPYISVYFRTLYIHLPFGIGKQSILTWAVTSSGCLETWIIFRVTMRDRIIRINRFQIQRNENSLFCQVNNLIDNGLQFRWLRNAKCYEWDVHIHIVWTS